MSLHGTFSDFAVRLTWSANRRKAEVDQPAFTDFNLWMHGLTAFAGPVVTHGGLFLQVYKDHYSY
jgi:hypothetical protein